MLREVLILNFLTDSRTDAQLVASILYAYLMDTSGPRSIPHLPDVVLRSGGLADRTDRELAVAVGHAPPPGRRVLVPLQRLTTSLFAPLVWVIVGVPPHNAPHLYFRTMQSGSVGLIG